MRYKIRKNDLRNNLKSNLNSLTCLNNLKNHLRRTTLTHLINFFALIGFFCINFASIAQADTIANYMTIIDNIPSMAMKPDDQSQAWVRSARNIVTSTDETMAQTIISMNSVAAKKGAPIFCFSQAAPFDAGTVDQIIQKTYSELLKMQGTSVGSMTVSDVLMIGMVSQYPCAQSPSLMSTNTTMSTNTAMPPVNPSLPANTAMPANPTIPNSEMSSSTGMSNSTVPSGNTPVLTQPYAQPGDQQSMGSQSASQPAMPQTNSSSDTGYNPYIPATQVAVSGETPPAL